MTLNNNYVIQNKELKIILEELENVITNINCFKKKHNGYYYNVKIVQNKILWDAHISISINKNEK